MNLHQLKIFYEVAKHESITKAAESLFISQPAVSKQIKLLENTYGIKLIEAKGRNIEITDFGRSILDLSKDLFKIETEIEDMLISRGRKESFTINIIGNYPAVSVFLPTVLKAFYESDNHGQVVIKTGSTYSAIETLVRHDAHLVMTGALQEDVEALEHCKLFSDTLCFIVNKRHPLAGKAVLFKDIVSEQFIGRLTESYSYNRLKQIFLKKGATSPHITMSYDLAYDGYIAASQHEAIYFGSYRGALPMLDKYDLDILNVSDIPEDWLEQNMFITSTKEALKRYEVRQLFNFIKTFTYAL